MTTELKQTNETVVVQACRDLNRYAYPPPTRLGVRNKNETKNAGMVSCWFMISIVDGNIGYMFRYSGY